MMKNIIVNIGIWRNNIMDDLQEKFYNNGK